MRPRPAGVRANPKASSGAERPLVAARLEPCGHQLKDRKMTRSELQSPTDLKTGANRDIPAALRALLADVFALYLKTKNFHWHMSGPHFRDYHLLLDEQADQIFAMTDDIAERARKI